MQEPIRVTVIKRTGRKFFECRWIDPGSGSKKTKTTKYTKRRDAERYAMEMERKLNAGETGLRRATFKAFRQEYEETVFPSQKLKTKLTTKSTFNAIESILKPSSVQSIDMAAIRKFTKEVRKLPAKGGTDKDGNVTQTVSEFTVVRHLTELRKILRWAAENKFLKAAPPVKVPEAKGCKGRDLTEEEFEQLLTAVRKVKLLESQQWESYEFLLKGLWWGGLRLGEALRLDWEDDTNLRVDLSLQRPMFRIQATDDKGGKYRILPMAPEFSELLNTIPEEQRTGKVFKLVSRCGPGHHLADRASHVISAIGKEAGIVVSDGGKLRKHASAHDLRRAFGVRWARRVLPPVLMEMMRHEDINTTMLYYVGQNADRAASDAWAAYEKTKAGNKIGNSPQSQEESQTP